MTNSNTNFPPGPWYVERSPMGVRVTHGELEEDGFLRDDVPGIGRVGELGDERALAIAHLIAAAPEMLEACKAALPFAKQYGTNGFTASMIEAAIAKAEGRS